MRPVQRHLVGSVLVTVAALATGPAVAQSKQQVDQCKDKAGAFTLDVRINACTAAIQSGRLSGKDLAWAFTTRGVWYQNKADFDHAIADFTDAIRLDPKLVAAYDRRGTAHLDKRDLDLAIADFTDAIGLDPKDGLAYNNRGLAYNGKGDVDRAIADYNQAVQLDPQYANAYDSDCRQQLRQCLQSRVRPSAK